MDKVRETADLVFFKPTPGDERVWKPIVNWFALERKTFRQKAASVRVFRLSIVVVDVWVLSKLVIHEHTVFARRDSMKAFFIQTH